MDREMFNASRRDALVMLGAGVVATAVASEALAQGVAAESDALEKAVEALRAALVDGDGTALNKLLHDRMTYSHSDGRVWTKQVTLDSLVGKKRYLSVVTSEQTVDVIGTVGIVRHISDVVTNVGEGKTVPSHIKVLHCWIKSGGNWQLLARAATTIPA